MIRSQIFWSKRSLFKVAFAVIFIGASNANAAQLIVSNDSKHTQTVEGPALELARSDLAIIRWTTINPGGSDEHFGVVYYGLNSNNLTETAKSHIRLNPGHSRTTFRVRIAGLKPRTTYYYRVISVDSAGGSDGEKSTLHKFTTPSIGERFVAYPLWESTPVLR